MDKNDPYYAQHMAHCNTGEYIGTCKYGDDDCPRLDARAALVARYAPLVERIPYPNTAAIFVNDTSYAASFKHETMAKDYATKFIAGKSIDNVVIVEFIPLPIHAPGAPVVLRSVTIMTSPSHVVRTSF
jgi:hypothetical protein